MIRPRALAWIGAIVVVAITLFLISYEVQRVEKEIAALDREATTQEEAIHVLRAEWSYLNRPDRLAALAERHLDLAPVVPAQLTAAKRLEAPLEPALVSRRDDRLQDLLLRVVGEAPR
ncbi:MAG: hypothetical protein AB7P52_06365 [Alphaproteobacteria bacterium]